MRETRDLDPRILCDALDSTHDACEERRVHFEQYHRSVSTAWLVIRDCVRVAQHLLAEYERIRVERGKEGGIEGSAGLKDLSADTPSLTGTSHTLSDLDPQPRCHHCQAPARLVCKTERTSWGEYHYINPPVVEVTSKYFSCDHCGHEWYSPGQSMAFSSAVLKATVRALHKERGTARENPIQLPDATPAPRAPETETTTPHPNDERHG